MVVATDVLFVATGHPQRGADASHRGGNPGFVEVVDANTLRIPDYSGNSLFNTLGNLLVDPRYGMLIPNFQSGRMLQLTGTAKVTWSGNDKEQRTGPHEPLLSIPLNRLTRHPPPPQLPLAGTHSFT